MATTSNNIPQGYKATALGIIPQEWEVMRLGDIVSITSGESPSLYHLKAEGKYPYVKVEDLNNCEKYQESSREYSDDNNTTIKAGSIIFPKRGASILNNKVRIAAKDIQMDSNMMAITPHTAIVDTEFLYIRILHERLYRIADTSSIPQINNKHIIPYKIAVPPLAEQRKIAEVLGVWDEAIEKQARLIEKLALRKRALMQRLLSAKLRLPGFSEPWQKVKLGDIGDTYNGLSGKNKDDFEYGNAQFIPYINVFSNERIDTNNLGCVQIKPNEQQNTVKYGDIFFTVSSETPDEVGMASVLLEHLDNTYLNSFCFGYRLNNFSTLNPFFAAYLFRTEHFRNYMSVLAQGSTRFNISKKEVMKLKIDLPTIEEQTAIAEVLTAADREIELAKEKLDRLRRQKRGLMQQLLTGKKGYTYDGKRLDIPLYDHRGIR